MLWQTCTGRSGHSLALMLGVAAFGSLASVALSAAVAAEINGEIIVTADRLSDEATSAKVTEALQQDPFIFSDHVVVETHNGVVRLKGTISDLPDLYMILKLARNIAGKGRVANELEYLPLGADHD
jgi:osmotically-inducible protein OsmY